MAKLLTISKLKLSGKTVLLRVDLNSSIVNRKALDSMRFKEHAKTISFLKRKGARVVVLAHQGRPGAKDFTNLKSHAKILNKYVKIKFIQDVIGTKAINAINNLKNGEAILLDNVRKLKDEFKPSISSKFVKTLSSVADIFVQDALSVCHRKHASVVSFPKLIKSYTGLVLEGELKALSKIKKPQGPVVYILGGMKSKDYLELIKKAKHEKAVILTIGMINVPGVVKPFDYHYKKGEDIGEKTIKEYLKFISGAKTIFMKGSVGRIEEKRFQNGTVKLLKAISSNRKAFSVIGGGSLLTIIKELRINTKKFSYVSLSGGALVKYLAGEKLPGLEVLKK